MAQGRVLMPKEEEAIEQIADYGIRESFSWNQSQGCPGW